MDAVAYIINGETVIIDRDWLPYVQSKRWYISATGTGYGYATHKRRGQKIELLHRTVIGAQAYQLVDHVNCNSLDNRRENLRLCTRVQNGFNRGAVPNKSSIYKGVNKKKTANETGRDCWVAEMRIGKKKYYLGLFSDEVEAAKAYDAFAIEMHGEWANINFKEPYPEVKISEVFYQPGRRDFTSSKYMGVSFKPEQINLPWHASIQKDKKKF